MKDIDLASWTNRLMTWQSRVRSRGGQLAVGKVGSPLPNLLEVNAWAASGVVLKMVKIVGYHPYPLDELMLMVAAFAYHRPDVVIDIGTHYGKSARIWFELARLCRTPVPIHTIDILDPSHPEFPGQRHGVFIRGTSVIKHVADGYSCATEIIAADPSLCYLIFLDGDHSYDTVRRELGLLNDISRGCLLVHDTFFQPGSTYNQDPYNAIQDVLQTFTCKQVIHIQTGLPGMSYLGRS